MRTATQGFPHMAILHDGDLSLEIKYREFEFGWVYYDIWPRWRGEPILNDAILKRVNEHWAKRGVGAIKAYEHQECGILPLLRRVLDGNKADYWEATDPDILLAVYPDDAFPFLPSKWNVVYVAPEVQAARLARATERAKHGPLPDDYIELMLFVDVYNFEGATAYSGSGLCFKMITKRVVLQQFHDDLRREYLAFRDHWQIQEKNEAEWGPGYEAPEF